MKDYKVFNLKKYHDLRGYFYESYSHPIATELGEVFVQDNVSFSYKGTIRGLHYQWDAPMGKLVHVLKGSIIDYIVDLRHGSATYGCYEEFEISDENNKILWVPPGYAHGFEVLEDSLVMYKCTAFYNPMGEGGINLYDADIAIKYRTLPFSTIISDKDKKAKSLKEYDQNPIFFSTEEK